MATTGVQEFKNYVGGYWVDAASGETFQSTSPADGEPIGVLVGEHGAPPGEQHRPAGDLEVEFRNREPAEVDRVA